MSENKAPAWSHTSLSQFETCPKQYYHTRVVKDVTQDFGEAALWGQEVHKKLENRLLTNTQLPDHLKYCEPICQDILSRPGTLMVEEKMGLNKDLKPVTFFAKDVWARAVVDVGIVNNENAVILDWKTGKRKPDSDQMKLFAAFSFAKFPLVQKITTAFVWLKEHCIDKETFHREEDEAIIWQEVMPRVKRVELAYEKDKWPAKPSGLCKKHCPVKSCEHNGQ